MWRSLLQPHESEACSAQRNATYPITPLLLSSVTQHINDFGIMMYMLNSIPSTKTTTTSRKTGCLAAAIQSHSCFLSQYAVMMITHPQNSMYL